MAWAPGHGFIFCSVRSKSVHLISLADDELINCQLNQQFLNTCKFKTSVRIFYAARLILFSFAARNSNKVKDLLMPLATAEQWKHDMQSTKLENNNYFNTFLNVYE